MIFRQEIFLCVPQLFD